MSRGAEQRIADILKAIDRCQRYTDALDEKADADLVDMAEDAVERNLQIIGEAANHLSSEITEAHPEIAWPQIRGFRNILVHQLWKAFHNWCYGKGQVMAGSWALAA